MTLQRPPSRSGCMWLPAGGFSAIDDPDDHRLDCHTHVTRAALALLPEIPE